MQDNAIRVFISYSHDSPEHAAAVLQIAQRLRDEGIDASIDQFFISPPEGWPSWMMRQVQEARFVLVVCTPGYAAKLDGTSGRSTGLGVKWEGALITSELYELGGHNEKYVPILFDDGDVHSIPRYLTGATRYNVRDEHSYVALYRHLTNQPRVEPRPLGALRRLPAETPVMARPAVERPSTAGDADPVLLFSHTAGVFVVPALEIVSSDTVTFKLAPSEGSASDFLRALAKPENSELAVAYANNAALCKVLSVESVRRGGQEVVSLAVRAIESDYGTMMEMSTTGFSADRLAELRARRLLLDERGFDAPDNTTSSTRELDQAMLEVLVRGLNVPLEVHESPIPLLFEISGSEPEVFLRDARLLCVLYLRLSGAVERTTRLDLSLSGDMLSVDFEGFRSKRYSNREPHRILVSGTLRLPSKAG